MRDHLDWLQGYVSFSSPHLYLPTQSKNHTWRSRKEVKKYQLTFQENQDHGKQSHFLLDRALIDVTIS